MVSDAYMILRIHRTLFNRTCYTSWKYLKKCFEKRCRKFREWYFFKLKTHTYAQIDFCLDRTHCVFEHTVYQVNRKHVELSPVEELKFIKKKFFLKTCITRVDC